MFKRDLTIVDDSLAEIRLTIWNDDAQRDDAEFDNNPVVYVAVSWKLSSY